MREGRFRISHSCHHLDCGILWRKLKEKEKKGRNIKKLNNLEKKKSAHRRMMHQKNLLQAYKKESIMAVRLAVITDWQYLWLVWWWQWSWNLQRLELLLVSSWLLSRECLCWHTGSWLADILPMALSILSKLWNALTSRDTLKNKKDQRKKKRDFNDGRDLSLTLKTYTSFHWPRLE